MPLPQSLLAQGADDRAAALGDDEAPAHLPRLAPLQTHLRRRVIFIRARARRLNFERHYLVRVAVVSARARKSRARRPARGYFCEARPSTVSILIQLPEQRERRHLFLTATIRVADWRAMILPSAELFDMNAR